MAEEISPESKVYVKEKIKTKRLFSFLLTTVVLLAVVLLSGCPSPEPKDLTDSDGDGVPDKLEINGYYWKDGKFRQWNGKSKVTYYRTDPAQRSTDQDPYSDGMEVSGVKMDTSVAAPGNHPLVPAYPDIYVSMVGFDVERRAEITSSAGGKLQEGWRNSTTDEKTMEHHWDFSIKYKYEYKVGIQAGSAHSVQVAASAGGRYGSNNSVTNSTSGFSEKDWKEATATNPAEAAKIKLRLRFENRGTAAAQNIIPTVNLILGDKTACTYEMREDKIIDSLAVGERFPKSGEWVIGDKPKTLRGLEEIILTLDELRSIQLGIPVFMEIPQIDAKILALNEKGYWEVVDSWQNYKARIDGVCARITVDLGHGKMKDYRVFARSQNGPEVTLKDALKWTVGCEETAQGVRIMSAPVGNWLIGFSDNAIDNVMAQLNGRAGNNVLDVILDAGWEISIKAPSGKVKPEIVWCSGSQEADTTFVKAMVIDDYEVSKVVFKTTPDANGQEMERELTGTGIYQIALPDYSVTGKEIIVATNDRDNSATKPVDLPRWAAPIANGLYVITSVISDKSLDLDKVISEAGANVIQNQYYGNPTQLWSLENVGRGYYKIMAKDSKTLCLEVVEGGTEDNAGLRLHNWQDADHQKWALEPAGDGSFKIIARHSGKCLDIINTKQRASVIQYTDSGSESQKWIVQPADSYPAIWPTYNAVRDKVQEEFIIFSEGNYDKCLDVLNQIKDDGTPVVAYSWWGGDNQRWRLEPVGDGYFRICAKHSDKCLTVETNGIFQNSDEKDDSQKWRFKKINGQEFYYIENKRTGNRLTVTSEKELVQEVTSKRIIWGQKWQLKPAEQSWLGNIDVTVNKNVPQGEGWTKVKGTLNLHGNPDPYGKATDLNRGCGGETPYIWLWARGPAQDNIIVTIGEGTDKDSVKENTGWKQIGPDLNRDAGGNYLYLWVRGPAKDNIIVTVGRGTHTDKQKEDQGWRQIGQDLNMGVGGNFLYLWVR